MAYSDICGCYYTTSQNAWALKRRYLPQFELSSHTTVNPLCFTTHLTQTFVNPSSDLVAQACYTFPLYDGVAVTAFTCTIGERTIVGHVEQKDQARQTYNNAVEKGESAGLLESLPLGVFGVTLGNIPQHTNVVVSITYGGELKHDAEVDGLRFTLPTSIAPRYGEYPGELLQAGPAISSRGIRIVVDADMKDSTIRKIQSPSKDHPISISLGCLSTASERETPMASKASVSLALETVELSTDFVLQIVVDDIGSPKAVLQRHPTLPNHQALITAFVPRFDLKMESPEIVFIADQSGSMQGAKNESLVAALVTLLKSLPFGVRFNICAFGTHHEFLWENSRPYTSANVTEALAYVQGFEALLGSTQMYSPVEATFEKRLGDVPLEIVLLTDGEITDENLSTTLVEGVARAGRGFAQFVTEGEIMDHKVVRILKATLQPHINDFSLEVQHANDEDDCFEIVENEIAKDKKKDFESSKNHSSDIPEELVAKVSSISMFDANIDSDAPIKNGDGDRYAHLSDLAIPPVLQTPQSSLFLFNRNTEFMIMEDRSNKTPVSVILRAKSSQGPLELSIPIQLAEKGSTIHTLGVRNLTRELEEGRGWVMDAMLDGKPVRDSSRAAEYAEREAVRLGVKYSVANKCCSFVAVEDDTLEAHDDRSQHRLPKRSSMALPAENIARASLPRHRKMKRMSQADSYYDGVALSVSARSFGPSLNRLPPNSYHMPLPNYLPSAGDTHRNRAGSWHDDDPVFYSAGHNFPMDPDDSDDDRSDTPPFAAAEPVKTDLEKVRLLISLQTFAGYWVWSTAVLKSLDIDTASVLKDKGSKSDDITMTTLVLDLLRTKLSAFKEVWEMVADKADKWLAEQAVVESSAHK
ncbi:von Willebrand factor type A domain-containing protein [Delphinella strobiligena]|nr:von Willebrand factor type A domain-containing protein [Delphinella strobiligena]